MHAGLPRGAGASVGPVLLLASGLLAMLALFAGEGSSYSRLVGIGAVALALAGAGLAVAFWGGIGWPRLDRAGNAFVLLLAAFVLWTGLTVLWSITPDSSWAYFNRGLIYLAFVVLGLLLGAAMPRAVPVVAAALTILIAGVIAWALAGKVVPDLFPDGARIARLREPIGYWNGLALLAAMALPLGLWVAVSRQHTRLLRTAAVALLFAATVTLLLTYSRGGVVVALLLVVFYLAIVSQRLEAITALLLAVPAAAAVAAWAFSQPGLVDDRQSYDDRLRAGLAFGALLAVVGAAVAAATSLLLRREERWRPRFRWELSAARVTAGGAAALVVAVLAASGGHPVDWVRDGVREFADPVSPAGSEPGRLGSFSSNSRWTWWEEAWTLFEDEPVGGTGAASFAVARRPIRSNTTFATEPHNIALQFLAETGLVGFLLFAGAAAAATVGVVAAVRRLDGAEPAGSALAVVALAYLLHSLIDYDWDFVALTGPVLLVLGVMLAAGREPYGRARAPLWAAGAALLAVAAIVSLAAPWLATRDVDDAYGAIERRQPGKAVDEARRAQRLNPLSIEPLLARAAAEEARGDLRAAWEIHVEAVDLQPQNWRSWYELGRFELDIGRRDAGIRHLRRSRELDPLGPANDLLAAMGF
jgi:O-antigen ligase